MNRWQDTTSYSRGDRERVPKSFTLKLEPGLDITVTREHIYYKGRWIIHCYALGFDTVPLPEGITQEQAQELAIAHVFARAQRYVELVRGASTASGATPRLARPDKAL